MWECKREYEFGLHDVFINHHSALTLLGFLGFQVPVEDEEKDGCSKVCKCVLMRVCEKERGELTW